MIKIRVTGVDDVANLVEALSKRLTPTIHTKLEQYVKRHLVTRIKSRLAHGTQPHTTAVGKQGLIGPGGGYGLPHNEEEYAEWKATRVNLPLTGGLSTRELVATGYFVENISVTKAVKAADTALFEVGPKKGSRPKVFPFKNAPGSDDSADVSKSSGNREIAQYLEDSKYAFWAKEFDDVRRDLEPFLILVITDLIKELVAEFTSTSVDIVRK